MKPICPECKEGDIIKLSNYTTECIYDEQLEGFKLMSIGNEDVWFRCSKCYSEYNMSEITELMK